MNLRTEVAMVILGEDSPFTTRGFRAEELRDVLKASGCIRPGSEKAELAAARRYIQIWNKRCESEREKGASGVAG